MVAETAVETIRKAYFVDGMPYRVICKAYGYQYRLVYKVVQLIMQQNKSKKENTNVQPSGELRNYKPQDVTMDAMLLYEEGVYSLLQYKNFQSSLNKTKTT